MGYKGESGGKICRDCRLNVQVAAKYVVDWRVTAQLEVNYVADTV